MFIIPMVGMATWHLLGWRGVQSLVETPPPARAPIVRLVRPVSHKVSRPIPTTTTTTTVVASGDPPVYVMYPDGTCGQTGQAEARRDHLTIIPAAKDKWCSPPYYWDPWSKNPQDPNSPDA